MDASFFDFVFKVLTALSVAGILGLIRWAMGVNTQLAVLRSHSVTTEQMRAIMENNNRAIEVKVDFATSEIQALDAKVERLQAQVAGRRSND